MRLERLLLTLTLFMALAAGDAWADEMSGGAPDDSSAASNIEGWDDDEEEDATTWTWFGMGFESRQAASGAAGAGGASGAASSIKKGGSRKGK